MFVFCDLSYFQYFDIKYLYYPMLFLIFEMMCANPCNVCLSHPGHRGILISISHVVTVYVTLEF